MAESTKVRLVLCPKCENLLPVLEDYSFYQCGGCDAVLGENNDQEPCILSEKSDEEKVVDVATKLQTSENGMVESSDASETETKVNAGFLKSDEMNPKKIDVDLADGSKNQSSTTGKSVVGNDLDVKMDRDDINNAVGGKLGDLNSQNRHTNGSWRSGKMSSWQHRERGATEGLRRIMSSEVEGVRFSTSKYPDDGPSNCNLNSSHSHGEPTRNGIDQDRSNKIQYLENDRLDLLRKLDELKEQLNKSCDVADRSKDKVSHNGAMAPSDPFVNSNSWCPGSSSASDRASMQFLVPDKQTAAPSYFSHHPEPFPYPNGNEMSMHHFHPSMQKLHHIPGYGDPFGSQMLGRAPHQLTGQYQLPSRQCLSGHYLDNGPVPLETYPSNAPFHQPSCSCFHCHDKHHGVSAPVRSSAFGNQRFPDFSNNPVLHHHENPGAFGSYVYSSRNAVPSMNYRAPQSRTRWPSDLNSEIGSFVRRPQRMFSSAGGRSCHPIAGGAPFFTCFNCFELLQLPKKLLLMTKNQYKMRCSTCSAVINFSVVSKKLVMSVGTVANRIPAEVDDSSNEMMKEAYTHGHINRINVNFSSDDYDNSEYDFQTIDTDPVTSSTGPGFNSTKPHEMRTFHSSSLSTSEDDNSPNVLIAPIKGTLSPSPPPGSPLQQHFDYSSNNHAVNRFGKGNRSSRSDQEKVVMNKANTRQNSMKEASLATEMDVPFHEYSNTGVSQDSGDTSREDTLPKSHKGGESFFANIIKKSFKDFSRSSQTDDRGRGSVFVNGHLLPDRVVKKAEKLAGPIQPGKYWYDFRAGFWGIMEGHCLGIIPPFIEEFNYAMPENCAGGTTGVFVNGRELHQNDLDLLASRGLPTDRDRSYIIEISGRVVDEDTGEELDSLGKLAPTVERVKRGFGLKLPKAAAS